MSLLPTTHATSLLKALKRMSGSIRHLLWLALTGPLDHNA